MIQSGITARRAGEILNIPLSTIYYQSARADRDKALANAIQEIAFKHTFLATEKNRPRNKKKIAVERPLTEPLFCNHVWAIDFLLSISKRFF